MKHSTGDGQDGQNIVTMWGEQTVAGTVQNQS